MEIKDKINSFQINNNNLSIKSINNSKIFEFPGLLDKISLLLKDFYHNDDLYINNIKLISESINEQTLFARCSFNDIMLYINQITNPRFNGVLANMNEKYIKEKLNLINNRLGKIDELKDNLNQNIRNTEMELINYYEESKEILQKIKILYKYGNGNNNFPNNKFNIEQIEIMKKNYKSLLNENNILKMNLKINNSIKGNNSVKNKNTNKKSDFNLSFGNKRNNSFSKSNAQKYNIKTNNSVGILKEELKKIKNFGNKINIKVVNNKYKNNRNKKNNINKINSLTLSKNTEEINKNKNSNIGLIVELASMMLNFLNDIKNLQEFIIKKNNNIKEFKKNFEINKKSLKIFCEKILYNKDSPEKLKTINFKNIKSNLSKSNEKKNISNNIVLLELKINSLEKALIEKNNKIVNLQSEISKYISKNKQLMKQINEFEKEKNKSMNLIELNGIKENITNLNAELNNKNVKIKSLESIEVINKQLLEKLNNQKTEIDNLNCKLKNEMNKSNDLNFQLTQLKNLENENNELRQQISQYNNNVNSISLKNDFIIKEKDIIINNLNNNIKELNNQIYNNKFKDSEKENYNKIYLEIKEMLNEINDESKKNINELLEKDKNFDLCIHQNNNIQNEKMNEEIKNKLNYFRDIQKENENLINELKNNNSIFQKINNNDNNI